MKEQIKGLSIGECVRCTAVRVDIHKDGLCSDCRIQRHQLAYDKQIEPVLLDRILPN